VVGKEREPAFSRIATALAGSAAAERSAREIERRLKIQYLASKASIPGESKSLIFELFHDSVH